ncbi:MAG: hypothetical protein ACOYXT_29930 [Bacteroidota bacterium]
MTRAVQLICAGSGQKTKTISEKMLRDEGLTIDNDKTTKVVVIDFQDWGAQNRLLEIVKVTILV